MCKDRVFLVWLSGFYTNIVFFVVRLEGEVIQDGRRKMETQNHASLQRVGGRHKTCPYKVERCFDVKSAR